ncbi:pilus assembly protein [Stenotrophomonas hibiscicola]|uniref:pilus assembly protein n=1 Tax=Stenotrophomonas hibiscicola TaxID=86189 RepID=UPI002E77BD4A|nr:pilus assembly protein [[Pseudomonas] hibiscicola]
MKRLSFCLLPLCLLLAVPAQANLTVHPMRTSVDAKRGTQIRVYSQSAQPQYIQASLRRIVNPADADEREVEVEPGDAAIAVTPAKFALSGAGNRLIRVIPLQPVEREAAYRVYFEGVSEPEGATADAKEAAEAKVGFNLVWGALVNVLPADGTVLPRLQGDTLRNDGTLRLGITSISDCIGNRCTAHDVSRSLYPGSALQLPFAVEDGHTVQLRYRLTRDGYREHVQTLSP